MGTINKWTTSKWHCISPQPTTTTKHKQQYTVYGNNDDNDDNDNNDDDDNDNNDGDADIVWAPLI